MLIAFLVICLTLFVCTVFGIPLYVTKIALALIVLAIAALLLWLEKLQKKTADNVVKADLIEEIAVYKEELKNTGFSVGRKGEYFRHYGYEDVLHHYECVFKVMYKDGRIGELRCRKDSALYDELIKKPMLF